MEEMENKEKVMNEYKKEIKKLNEWISGVFGMLERDVETEIKTNITIRLINEIINKTDEATFNTDIHEGKTSYKNITETFPYIDDIDFNESKQKIKSFNNVSTTSATNELLSTTPATNELLSTNPTQHIPEPNLKNVTTLIETTTQLPITTIPSITSSTKTTKSTTPAPTKFSTRINTASSNNTNTNIEYNLETAVRIVRTLKVEALLSNYVLEIN